MYSSVECIEDSMFGRFANIFRFWLLWSCNLLADFRLPCDRGYIDSLLFDWELTEEFNNVQKGYDICNCTSLLWTFSTSCVDERKTDIECNVTIFMEAPNMLFFTY